MSPDTLGGTILIVRHPHAASSAQMWNDVSRGDTTWSLGTPADPLTSTFERRGKTPLRPGYPASVVLWLNGVRLSSQESAFAAWSRHASGQGGMWVGRNLPQSSVRVLGSVKVDPQRIAEGLFDSLSSEITYPWRQDLRVEAVE